MNPDSNFHSWFVGWVKIILPMAALALLSTLFLFARSPADTPDFLIPQLQDLAREQQIRAPKYSSITNNGAIIALTATAAKPDPQDPDGLLIEDLLLELESSNGNNVQITSGTSTVNATTQTAQMNGLTRVTTSTGYIMETVGIGANLISGEIVSDGALEIQAPFGALTAGKVHINLSPSDQEQQIVFTQGIRLLYTVEQTQP